MQNAASNNPADQGELISRIKSLELENRSLHKGGLIISFTQKSKSKTCQFKVELAAFKGLFV